MRRSTTAKARITLIALLLLALSSACQFAKAPDTRASDEDALRKQDEAWSKAAGTMDVEKTVSFYSSDAVVMPPNSPVLNSKDSIHALWKGMLSAPGFSGGWKPNKIEIAGSGDLGYITGTYEFTENDASGKPTTDRGKYLEVWKKSDGNWKCVADIFNTDLPLASARKTNRPGSKQMMKR